VAEDNKKNIEQLQAEIAALKKENARLHTLFDNSPLGIFRTSLEGRYIEVNHTLATMLGYDSVDELMKTVGDVSSQVYFDPKSRKSIIEKTKKTGKPVNIESYFRKKNNHVIPVNLSVKMVKDEEGHIYGIEGIVQDISIRKAFENELRKEKDQHRFLIDNVPEFIYYIDPDLRFVFVNKPFAEFLGFKNANKLVGLSVKDYITSDAKKGFTHDLKKILKEKKPIGNRELEIISKKSGAKIYTYTSILPILSDNNNISGLVGISSNITDLRAAQKQIAENEINLNTLIESSDSFIWSIDSEYRIITINSAFAEVFEHQYGHRPTQGDNILNFLPEDELKLWQTTYNRGLKGERWSEEMIIHLSNLPVYLELSINPIVNRELDVTGVTVFANNITERKRTEEALKESEEKFRQLAENINDAFIIGSKDKIIYVNPAFEKIFGRYREELIKNPDLINNISGLVTKNGSYKKNLEIGDENNAAQVRFHYTLPSGSERWLWTRKFNIFNAKGEPYRYALVTSDITEQKQLELALIQNKSQLQAILDNIPYLAWLKDKDGKYVMVNEPFAGYYKLNPDEIIGKTDFDLNTEKTAKNYKKNDDYVISSGKRELTEHTEEHDGKNRWVETLKTPILNSNGNIIGITGISRDITDRKQIEEAIKTSGDQLRSLLQNSSDAINILDEQGKIIFESSIKSKISDFKLDELPGRSIFDIAHPDDLELIEETLEQVKSADNVTIKTEYRSLHRNKRWIYVESIFTNQFNNPLIKGIVVNTRDISERKMSELKEKVYHDNLVFLSNSALELLDLSSRDEIFKYIANKLEEYLVNAGILVLSFDENTEQYQVRYHAGMNDIIPWIERRIGRSVANMTFPLEKNITQLIKEGSQIQIQDDIEATAIEGVSKELAAQISEKLQINKVYNISLVRHNKLFGNVTIVTRRKSIIKFKHIIETFIHQVSVALHRSQLEHELIQAKEKAEESDKLKTAFLANMSHEIRTPMNGILGFTEMLSDENISPGNQKKYIDIINSNGKMLINLIDDIIDFAKIEAGEIKILKREFSLNSLLQQVHSSFLTESMRKDKQHVKLRLRKAFTNESCYIFTDPNRLRQILTNLISNAFKFTKEGMIEFGYNYNEQEKYLYFYVSDTGIGIPEDKIATIFNRFIQADNSYTRKYGGSGLGLAISKGFAELLGGKMWLESEEGKGSTFHFTLPYVKAEKSSTENDQKLRKRNSYDWSGKLFLIAEDDRFSYKFLESFLKQTNAEVIHAADGKEAVEKSLENSDIDLVLMDIQMPELNGLEATKKIKEIKRDLVVIAQTANAQAEERQKCIDWGCNDFITKPVNIDELYAKIDKYVPSKLKPENNA